MPGELAARRVHRRHRRLAPHPRPREPRRHKVELHPREVDGEQLRHAQRVAPGHSGAHIDVHVDRGARVGGGGERRRRRAEVADEPQEAGELRRARSREVERAFRGRRRLELGLHRAWPSGVQPLDERHAARVGAAARGLLSRGACGQVRRGGHDVVVDLCTACARIVRGMCTACAWHVRGACMARAWHAVCVACAWHVHGRPPRGSIARSVQGACASRRRSSRLRRRPRRWPQQVALGAAWRRVGPRAPPPWIERGRGGGAAASGRLGRESDQLELDPHPAVGQVGERRRAEAGPSEAACARRRPVRGYRRQPVEPYRSEQRCKAVQVSRAALPAERGDIDLAGRRVAHAEAHAERRTCSALRRGNLHAGAAHGQLHDARELLEGDAVPVDAHDHLGARLQCLEGIARGVERRVRHVRLVQQLQAPWHRRAQAGRTHVV
eukprot:scaffold29149_cov65-Phaeocystis_antarctica.AAC.6